MYDYFGNRRYVIKHPKVTSYRFYNQMGGLICVRLGVVDIKKWIKISKIQFLSFLTWKDRNWLVIGHRSSNDISRCVFARSYKLTSLQVPASATPPPLIFWTGSGQSLKAWRGSGAVTCFSDFGSQMWLSVYFTALPLASSLSLKPLRYLVTGAGKQEKRCDRPPENVMSLVLTWQH